MSIDSIPHLSLGTSILLIFAVCVALVLLRGMARILTGTAIFAASGWAGLTIWHITPELSQKLLGKPIDALLIALPIIAFAATFWFLIKALQFVLTPFDALRSDDKPKTSLITSLIVAIIPTAVLFLLVASLFHHFGTIEEIRTFAATPDSDKPNRVRLYLRSCQTSLDTILPAPLLRKLDPATDPERVRTAKLVALRSAKPPAPVIDPATGLPYPRAIIVDDPALQNLAREGKFGSLLRHPVLTKATQDPTVRKLLSHLNLQ